MVVESIKVFVVIVGFWRVLSSAVSEWLWRVSMVVRVSSHVQILQGCVGCMVVLGIRALLSQQGCEGYSGLCRVWLVVQILTGCAESSGLCRG